MLLRVNKKSILMARDIGKLMLLLMQLYVRKFEIRRKLAVFCMKFFKIPTPVRVKVMVWGRGCEGEGEGPTCEILIRDVVKGFNLQCEL